MKVSIEGVPVNALDAIWPSVEPMVVHSLNETGFNRAYGSSDILSEVYKGHKQLFICVVDNKLKGFAVTHIVDYPKERITDIFLCGGEQMNDWVLKLWQTLKQHAKDAGCGSIRAFGRKGWVKVLPDDLKSYAMWTMELT